MNVIIVDLGQSFIKISLFEINYEKKDVVKSYQLVKTKIFNTISDKILSLELKRFIDSDAIDDIVFIVGKSAVNINCSRQENELTEEKMFRKIQVGTDIPTEKDKRKKKKADGGLTTIELQNFSTDSNYTDVVVTRVMSPDYFRIIDLVKDLKIKRFRVVDSVTCLPNLVSKGKFIFYDLGNTEQSLTYIDNGIIKSYAINNLGIKEIDEELSNKYPNEDIKIKHSSDLFYLDNEVIEQAITSIFISLEDFIKKNKINEKETKLVLLGGNANLKFEDISRFDIPLSKFKFSDKRFVNRAYISDELMNYLLPTLAVLKNYIEGSKGKVLSTKNNLSLLSTKLDNFNLLTKGFQITVASLMIVNLLGGLFINKSLEEYSQYEEVSPVSDTAKKNFQKTKDEIDGELNTSGLLKSNFKVGKIINLISGSLPPSASIDHLSYSKDTALFTLYTDDLEQSSVFVDKLKTIFQNVKLDSPTTVIPGKNATIKLQIECTGFKG